ncbi:hypothetical protein [Arundinibacter roseus]|uniref:Uncharacterized protein n=1 Tax=Arundinibacter roseus TaxID=2070510 RepID=A0A4R4KA15_9BACT|nr:hypothetical protein [Arundinibacter roseus]TDB64590.1 hypothetical protein EZE20_13040 [Arundinibacter roseus]
MFIEKSDVQPPGKKIITRMSTQTKWLLLAPLSLILIGYGLCVFSEAGNLKHSGATTQEWVLLGTYSLILINGGLSLFGQAVRYRVLMDVHRETRRSMRKLEAKISRKQKLKRSADKKAKSSTKTN